MAASTLLNAVTVGPNSQSAIESIALTGTLNGVAFVLKEVTTKEPQRGCKVLVQFSLDGTTYSDLQVINLETTPSPKNSFTSVVYGVVKAYGATNVQFAAVNTDGTVSATVTLTAIAVTLP